MLLCLFLVCTLVTLSGISTHGLEGSELLGVSAQIDIGIRIWHSLYTLKEVIVPISGDHLSDIFRYFYSWFGGGLNSLESQLRLSMVLGFGIPYIF